LNPAISQHSPILAILASLSDPDTEMGAIEDLDGPGGDQPAQDQGGGGGSKKPTVIRSAR
jgi:hypothetical protein